MSWDGDLPGHHRFYSTDPVGNRIEFLEPIAVGPEAEARRPAADHT